ncbi:MAG: methyltransferase domain-containing protein [Ferruginibacter sp.]|nr:methyltransferase domain-containing protein [Ferruginibacter sp.]
MNKSNEEENIKLDAEYWSNRYDDGTASWDLGQVSPPVKNYIDQLTDKNIRILIPGCGNTYEADYLLKLGFTNVTVIDIAPALVAQLNEKYQGNQNIKIILGDFFEHNGEYDLILEQTFFCALDPALRESYVAKMHELLAPGGKLAGVLFNRGFEEQGPPFGGDENQYRTLFGKYFTFKTFNPCYNSFPKRKDTELFIILVKQPV